LRRHHPSIVATQRRSEWARLHTSTAALGKRGSEISGTCSAGCSFGARPPGRAPRVERPPRPGHENRERVSPRR
jgi:hypothetical protein